MFKLLYDFFYDFIEYIIFGVLILLAFVLILSGSAPQVIKLQSNISDTFAFLSYPKNFINKTTNLMEENRQLRRQNLKLSRRNMECIEAYKENQRYKEMLGFID